MWPILLISLLGITVIVERMLFIIKENGRREPEVVEKMLECVEKGDVAGALALGKKSNDSVARILVYSLNNKQYSLGNAFVRASGQELSRYSQGMATLDTVITSAPLLGLLGTVTGMMKPSEACRAISVLQQVRSPAVLLKLSLRPQPVWQSRSQVCFPTTT